jgi:hypothetical protein
MMAVPASEGSGGDPRLADCLVKILSGTIVISISTVNHSGSRSAQSHLQSVTQRGLSLPRNRHGGPRVESEANLGKNKSKRTRTIAAIGLSSLMALYVVTVASAAQAVVFRLGGPDGVAGVDMTSTSALYASGHDEVVILIAQLGANAPGGDVFEDLGVPSISPEGDVVFGAETLGQDQRPRWDIYRANAGAPSNQRIVHVLDNAMVPDDCYPDFKVDPYAVAGANGVVAFLAPEASGKDAVFRYQNGRLSCVARIGDHTAQGHTLKLLYFGSADISDNGDLAFLARVEGVGVHGVERAVLVTIEGNSSPREVAREGDAAPGGGRFGPSFGRPAIVRSPFGNLIAFTNQNSSVSTAYISSAGRLARSLRTGTRTELGTLTYISQGRPGLLPDGTLIISGASKDRSALFKAKDNELTLIKRQGDLTQFGTRLETFVDPSVTSSGLVYLGGHDDRGAERLFVFESGNGLPIPIEASADVLAASPWMPPFFPGTLAVNQRGDLAALGVAPDSDSSKLRTVVFDW